MLELFNVILIIYKYSCQTYRNTLHSTEEHFRGQMTYSIVRLCQWCKPIAIYVWHQLSHNQKSQSVRSGNPGGYLYRKERLKVWSCPNVDLKIIVTGAAKCGGDLSYMNVMEWGCSYLASEGWLYSFEALHIAHLSQTLFEMYHRLFPRRT